MIARAKAAELLPKVTTPSILICSDQVIRCNGEIREKPVDEAEARRFLESYRTHPPECIDGVVVYNTLTGMWPYSPPSSPSPTPSKSNTRAVLAFGPFTGESFEGVAIAKQHFSSVPDHLIDTLIMKGDIFTCAGGFTVEDMTDFLGYVAWHRAAAAGLSSVSLPLCLFIVPAHDAHSCSLLIVLLKERSRPSRACQRH